MRYMKAHFLWVMLLVVAVGILTACAPEETPADIPNKDAGVYLKTEITSMDSNDEGFSHKWAYNPDGTFHSYTTQTIEDGETLGAEITYQWENGLISGATLKIPSGEIPVRYDYSAADPTVLEAITITDKDSPNWLEAECDAQGRVVKLDLGHYGETEAFWSYTYTYEEDSVHMESYSYGELEQQVVYDQKGNVLEDIFYFEGKQSTRSVYTYDANGYRDSLENYDADNKLTRRRTYKNNDRGDAVESDVFDSTGTLKAHYTLSYDDRGNMIDQNIYDGEGNLLKALKNQYTYEGEKLTAVRQLHIEGDKQQSVDFTVTQEGNTATVVTKAMEGEYFAENYTVGVNAAQYKVDDSGELVEKDIFDTEGSLAQRYRYERVPVSSENKWQEVDPKMLIDVLFWFYY